MEKKWLILGVLVSLVLTLSLVVAIPNPAPIYCENMGHTANDTDCIFNNNQSCNLWEFYNNTCGQEYVIELPCVGLSEGLSPGYECCEGLVSGSAKEHAVIGSDGVCNFAVGSFGVCLPCGDSVCDKNLENICNCEEDCLDETNVTECVEKEDCYPEGFVEEDCGTFYSCLNGSCVTGSSSCEQNNTNNNETETNQTRNRETIVNQTRTRIQDRTNITFVPWQKRNESECTEGCTCRGAVVTCPTENGREMTIEAGRSGNIITITMEKASVDTELELEQETNGEQITLKAKLKNGETREIKVMPEAAVEKALIRLRLRECREEQNCSAELKEIKEQLAYELQAERHSRILWVFQKKMKVMAQVSAENGEIITIKKPWWAFLAAEPEE